MQTTPLIEQYISIKSDHKDNLLFFRMGDFYELFFEDAIKAAEILNIILTKRGKYRDKDIPMCGFPHHSAEGYIKTLLDYGCHIAICEQLETPEEAKKRGYKSIVHRDVVRVITPGTLLEDSFLDQKKNNILLSLFSIKEKWAICWIDISTGMFQISNSFDSEIHSIVEQLNPSEILISKNDLKKVKNKTNLLSEFFTLAEVKNSNKEHLLEILNEKFSGDKVLEFDTLQMGAITLIINYLNKNSNMAFDFYDPPELVSIRSFLTMDAATRKNLEINKSIEGDKKNSLLSVIDNTCCLMGSRLLSRRLNAPSTNISEIISWQKKVKIGFENTKLNNEIRGILKKYPDTERSISRISRLGANPRDLQLLCSSIEFFLKIKEVSENLGDNKLIDHKEKTDNLEKLYLELKTALCEEIPLNTKEGNFINIDYNNDLKSLKLNEKKARIQLVNLQASYIELTKIKALKIKFNNVLGYFIEIPINSRNKVDDDIILIHRQTTTNTVRYKSVDLEKIELMIFEYSEKSLQLEKNILEKLCQKTLYLYKDFLDISKTIAELDLVTNFAFTAKKYNWVCPKVDNSKDFLVSNGRHSVIEKRLAEQTLKPFVPNNCFLNSESFLWLITGPNMAGKSTFLRQNAHIIILAQIGSYVPADKAHIGVVNRLFSRIGASDNISKGQSTFMVEMLETANILKYADQSSFIILDEIGRGTSTFDGLSIAWATLENLISVNKSRTLFATHYHELTEIEKTSTYLSNVSCEIKEWNEEIIYSYKISKGVSHGSLGIKVAELAGFPKDVLRNARGILINLENKRGFVKDQSYVEEEKVDKVREQLGSIDPDTITPKEALNWIYKLIDNV